MNRDEMILKAARILAELKPDEEWPTNDALGGHALLGTRDDEYRHALIEQARAVLDAILPQIETEEELEALPDGAVVIDNAGDPSVKEGTWWRVTPSVSVGPANLETYAPLTVVWTPQPHEG